LNPKKRLKQSKLESYNWAKEIGLELPEDYKWYINFENQYRWYV
jgi:diphthamide synthase subunit DPH2